MCQKEMSTQNKKLIISTVLIVAVLFSVSTHIPSSFSQPVLILASLKQVKSEYSQKMFNVTKV